MVPLKFGKEQKLGIKEIDIQHEGIYNTVNHLYKIKKDNPRGILKTFEELLDQLKKHFDTEEKFMKDHKTIFYISHKLEHDRALNKYSNYYKDLKSGKTRFDEEIIESLKNWLESHLEKKDFKLKELIN